MKQLVPRQSMIVSFEVNNTLKTVEVKAYETLAEVLREKFGLSGVRLSCNRGACGECTVILDGEAVLACSMLAADAHGKKIQTIEGLEKDGQLHPLQKAFVQFDDMQCGYCTPGMILSLKALLDRNPRPTEAEIKEAISGNICRCGTYRRVVEAALSTVKSREIYTDSGDVA